MKSKNIFRNMIINQSYFLVCVKRIMIHGSQFLTQSLQSLYIKPLDQLRGSYFSACPALLICN